MAANLGELFRGMETMVGSAKILPNASRVTRKFGDVEFQGWEVGRFFAVHDETHSPGHLSFYDPEHKAFLTGDATLEINPAFFNSSLNNCIAMMKKFQRFRGAGVRATGYRCPSQPDLVQPPARGERGRTVDPLQCADTFEGSEACAGFYSFFESYYRWLGGGVLAILQRRGEATVPSDHRGLQEESKSPRPLQDGAGLSQNSLPIGRDGRRDSEGGTDSA